MSIICDPSGEWSISQEDIFKINRKVAGMLAEKIEKNSKIDLGKFINAIFDEVVTTTGDQQRALAVARHIPFAIELSKQVYSDKIRVPLHKNKLLDSAALEDVTVSFTESLDNVAKFLNTYRDSLKPKVRNTGALTNSSAGIQPKPKVDVLDYVFVPDDVLTTTGEEVNAERDLRWYYNFLKYLGDQNIYPNADGTINYFGKRLQLSMMSGYSIPVENLYPYERVKPNIEKMKTKQIFIGFTDTDGNFVYFDDSYNLTDNQGTFIYFPLRTIPSVISEENGKRIFDIDESVKNRRIQPISSIVANRRLAGEETTEELVRSQINQNYNDLKDLTEYLLSKGNYKKKLKLNMNRLSRGFIFRTSAEGKTPVSEIANVAEFNPVVLDSAEAKGTVKTAFYAFGVNEPISFTMADFPKDLAEQTADLLLNDIYFNGNLLTPSEKAQIISQYVGFNLNDKTGPSGTTGFMYDPKTGEILLDSKPISVDKQEARGQIADFLTREISRKEGDKEIKFTNKLYFNQRFKDDNFTSFKLVPLSEGFDLVKSQDETYNDWVKKNAFVYVKTTNKEIREENGYVSFDVPIDSLTIARKKMTDEQIKEFKQKQEEKKTAPDSVLKNNASPDSATNLADLLMRRNMTGFEITATPEQIEKAKEDYDTKVITFRDKNGNVIQKKLTDLIPYEVMFNIANSNGNVRATWTRAGITLFQGSDYTDLYHESWHAFTQWFLTGDQKLKLYNEVKNSGETIRYYDNGWKTMNSSKLDFNNPDHILYAEEHLAEKFREYSLGKYTPTSAVEKSIFKKIWEAIKALFGFGSPEEVLAPSGLVAKAFQDLKAGNLVDYTFDQANISFNRLNSGITALKENKSPITSLDITSSLMVTEGLTDVISTVIDDLNKQTNTNKFTIGVFENDTVKKEVLTRAKSKLIDKVTELQSKLELATGFEKDRLEKAIDTLSWAIDNFDVNNVNAGTLKYYNDRTGFFDLSTGAKVMDTEIAVEGQTEDNVDAPASREGITTDEGTEFSAVDRMSESMRYILESLFERVKPTKDNPEGYVYNELGFRKTVPMRTAFAVIASATANKLTPEEMYKSLQVASDTKTKDKEQNYKFLFLKQLLEKLGDPRNPTSQSLTGQNLIGEFFFTFRLDKQTGIQLTVENGETLSVKVGTSDSAEKAFGKTLENRFQTGKVKSKYISKNKNNEYEINLAKIIEDFPSSAAANASPISFLRGLGIDITDTDAVINFLKKQNAITNIHQTVLDRLKTTEATTGLTSDKRTGLFYDKSNVWATVLEAESKYSGFNAGYMFKNVNGDAQSEMNNPSTAGNMIHFINAAKTYAQLISDPRAAHYSTERNPWVKTSVMFQKLFGKNLTIKNTENGKEVSIEVKSLLGTQALEVSENDIRSLISGMKSAASDEQTAYLRDYFMVLLNGASEAFRHADKSSAYVAALNTGKVFHYVDPEIFNSSTGRTRANSILLGYVASELERIKKVGSEKVIGEQADDIILGGKPGKYETYKTRGSEFVIFHDILEDELKQELINLDVKTVEEFMDLLKTNENLEKKILTDLNNYFDKLALEDYSKLKSFGVTKASGFFDNIRKRFIKLSALNNQDLLKATSEAFTYNSFIHRVEMSTLVYGDPALYTHDKDEHMKRVSGFFATGRIGRTDSSMNTYINTNSGSYHNTQWFKQSGFPAPTNSLSYQSPILAVAVGEDPVDRSVYLDEMLKLAKAQGIPEKDYAAYEDMKSADGEAWISFDAYRALEIRFRNWSPQKEDLYNKIINNEAVDSALALKTFFPVKKLQYSGPLDLSNFSAVAFHKYSLIPLIPTVIKGSRLETLHNKMVSEGIAYTVLQSGSKISSIGKNGTLDGFYDKDYNPKFADPNFKFTKNHIFVDYLKEQLVTKDKFKKEIDFPSQIRKLITLGMDPESPLVKTYLSNIDKMTEVAMNELKMELGYKDPKSRAKGQPPVNITKLLEYVKASLTAQDLSEQSIDFIKIGDDGKLVNILDLSEDPSKIEKIIGALVNKRINKQPVKGEQYIQGSSVGFEKFSKPTKMDLDKYGEWGLPFYRMSKNGKSVSAMKIKIALHGPFKNLLNLEHNDEKVIGTIERLNEMLKDETWLDKGDNRQMVTLIGARIPTQGPNSMEFMEVFEFLPEAAGNIMILPLEIVAKSGGDFDIDKLVTMIPNIVNNEGITEIERPKATRKLLNTILESKIELLDEIKEIRKKYIKSYLRPEFQEQIAAYEKEQSDAYTDFLAQWTNNYYVGGAAEKYYSRIDAAKVAIDRMYEMLDQEVLETRKGEYDQFIAEIAPLKEKLRILNREENSYRPKAYQQDVMNSMRQLLSRSDNYINLTRPNGTGIYTESTEDALFNDKSIVEFLGEFNRAYSKKFTKTNPLGSKKISPTRIMENNYNTTKAAALYTGKMGVGMLATGNTFHASAVAAGTYMSPFREEEKMVNRQPVVYRLKQELLLPHNFKTVDGQKVIDFSQTKDADLENYIRDAVSELMNGYLDVAKDEWVYDINAVKQLEPEFEFMMLAGVPVKTAALMLAQPLVRTYLSKFKEYASPYALFNPEDPISNTNFAKRQALIDVLIDNNMSYIFETDNEGNINTFMNTPSILTKLRETYLDGRANSSDFTNKKLVDNLKSSGSDLSKKQFAHFAEIIYMASQLTNLKMAIRFDTLKNTSYFDADQQEKGYKAILGKAFPKQVIDDLINKTVLKSFRTGEFLKEVISTLLPVRANPKVNQAIASIIENMSDLSMDDKEKLANQFNTDLLLYIFQNKLYNFDSETDVYRSADVSVAPSPIAKEQVLRRGAFLNPNTGVMHVDKNQIVKDFRSKAFTLPAYGGESKLAPLPSSIFDRYKTENRVKLYYKFVLERESLRNSYPYASTIESFEFKNFLVTIGLNDNIPMRYEEFIRNKALENLYLDGPLFGAEYKFNNIPTAVDKFLKILEMRPELITAFPVLDIIGTTKSGSYRFFKLNDRVTDGTILTAYKDQMSILADPAQIKVKDAEENLYISEFFAKLNTIGYLQAGNNRNSELYMMSILNMEPITSYIQDTVKNVVNGPKIDSVLEDFNDKFRGSFLRRRAISFMNYAQNGSSTAKEDKNKPVSESEALKYARNGKVKTGGVYINEDTNTLEDVYKYNESMFETRSIVTAADGNELTKRTYTITEKDVQQLFNMNPDATYVFEDSYPKVTLNEDGSLKIGERPNKPTRIQQEAFRAGLATGNSFAIPITKADGSIPAVEKNAVPKEVIDMYIQELVNLRDSGKTLIFPSEGLGNRLLGYYKNALGNLEIRKDGSKNVDLYLYLSKKLLENFGYRNPKMEIITKGFDAETLEGAATGLEYIQEFYIRKSEKLEEPIQTLTDKEVNDYINKCKGIS